MKRVSETKGWSHVSEPPEARETRSPFSLRASGKNQPANTLVWVVPLLNCERKQVRDHLVRPKEQMYLPKDSTHFFLSFHLFS